MARGPFGMAGAPGGARNLQNYPMWGRGGRPGMAPPGEFRLVASVAWRPALVHRFRRSWLHALLLLRHRLHRQRVP